MRRAFAFVVVLVGVFGLLSAAGYLALTTTTQRWFEHDLELRSRLAALAARRGLVRNWHLHPERLGQTLADITRDERIIGAAACTLDGEIIAATDGYPTSFTCAWVE